MNLIPLKASPLASFFLSNRPLAALFLSIFQRWSSEAPDMYTMVTMVTMGGDLQPGCLADRPLTGLGQLQINP